MFDTGDRVITPGGIGIVKYKIMSASSNYSEASSYSVQLDSELHNPNYSGSVYPAKEVAMVKETIGHPLTDLAVSIVKS